MIITVQNIIPWMQFLQHLFYHVMIYNPRKAPLLQKPLKKYVVRAKMEEKSAF